MLLGSMPADWSDHDVGRGSTDEETSLHDAKGSSPPLGSLGELEGEGQGSFSSSVEPAVALVLELGLDSSLAPTLLRLSGCVCTRPPSVLISSDAPEAEESIGCIDTSSSIWGRD